MKQSAVKTLALTLCALLLLLMLAACGGQSPSGSAPVQEPEDEPFEDPAPVESADASEALEAVALGNESGFVMDLPAGFRYDDAWYCYLSAETGVRIWAPDMDIYQTENEFQSSLENAGDLKPADISGFEAWKREDPSGFYGAETHYYISFAGVYGDFSGCHMWVSHEGGDLAATQAAEILTALSTIRKEGEAVGARPAAAAQPEPAPEPEPEPEVDPYESLTVCFTPAETGAMSTFMSGGVFAVDRDSLFGFGYASDGTQELVRVDLKPNGSFADVDSYTVLEKGVRPSYVSLYGDDVYYIRDGEGIYRIPKSGGEPELVIADAVDYLQIRNDSLYYCDGSYTFFRAGLNGENPQPVLDKEVYYPYLINDEWMVYQDDADDESLHLRHMDSGEDITLCPIPSHSPVIYGTDLYCQTFSGGDAALAKIDMDYVPGSMDNFSIEYGDKPVYAPAVITADGTLYCGLDYGYNVSRWTDVENVDGTVELFYVFMGVDYNVYWQLEDNFVVAAYVTLTASGNSQTMPWFD